MECCGQRVHTDTDTQHSREERGVKLQFLLYLTQTILGTPIPVLELYIKQDSELEVRFGQDPRMAGAATSLRGFVLPIIPPGSSDEIYSREEVDGYDNVMKESDAFIAKLDIAMGKIQPTGESVAIMDYFLSLPVADRLPYVCSYTFWDILSVVAQTEKTLRAQKIFTMCWIMKLLLAPLEPNDNKFISVVDSVLRAAIRFKGGIHVIRVLVSSNPFVVTHPSGPMLLLPVHQGLLYDCDLAILQELTKLRSVCRHRDFSGRTLLHWAIICDSSLDMIMYLFDQFPDVINCPTFQGPGHDILCVHVPDSKLDALCGDEERLQISGGCTPLCLALDLNLQKTPPRNNQHVIRFLVGSSVQSCMVPDDTGDIAFHKLLKGPYSAENMKITVIAFIQRHKQTAHAAAFVFDKNKCMLLELAFRLRLHADTIDIIGRFTSNMIEAIFYMSQQVLDDHGILPPDEYRDVRPWSFLPHPRRNGDEMPMLPSSGLSWMASNNSQLDHIGNIVTSFILGEDARQAASPDVKLQLSDGYIPQTPVQ